MLNDFIIFFKGRLFGELMAIFCIVYLYLAVRTLTKEHDNLEERYPMYSRRVRKRNELYNRFRLKIIFLSVVSLIIMILRSR